MPHYAGTRGPFNPVALVSIRTVRFRAGAASIPDPRDARNGARAIQAIRRYATGVRAGPKRSWRPYVPPPAACVDAKRVRSQSPRAPPGSAGANPAESRPMNLSPRTVRLALVAAMALPEDQLEAVRWLVAAHDVCHPVPRPDRNSGLVDDDERGGHVRGDRFCRGCHILQVRLPIHTRGGTHRDEGILAILQCILVRSGEQQASRLHIAFHQLVQPRFIDGHDALL